MEPANIDWKNIHSIYIEDELCDPMNAPKWVDFTAPENPVNDENLFCKPDCRHPKTAEDFLRSYRNSKVKHLRSASSISEPLPEGDRNYRRNEETDNIEISVDIKKVVRDNLLQIRTCPPSPQCFSASQPLRPTKSNPQDYQVQAYR